MADFYTQCPNMLIFGLPDLSNNDRMILLGLIYLAWGNEEPMQISMRDLAKFMRVSPSVLCDSAKNEGEKQKQIELGKFREGSLTKLSGHGYVTVEEIDGKTYITVHLSKIWEDNTAFRKQEGVPNSNTIKSKGVRNSNDSVRNSNSESPSSVLQSNTSVRNSNDNGSQISSGSGSSDQLRTNNNFNERKEESHSSTHTLNQSSSQKPDMTAYIRLFMRKFLLEMELTGDLMDKHLKYTQEAYYVSEVDKETFRFEAEKAIERSRKEGGDIDSFYDYLFKALHLTAN